VLLVLEGLDHAPGAQRAELHEQSVGPGDALEVHESGGDTPPMEVTRELSLEGDPAADDVMLPLSDHHRVQEPTVELAASDLDADRDEHQVSSSIDSSNGFTAESSGIASIHDLAQRRSSSSSMSTDSRFERTMRYGFGPW
jgi:hypothetical protein